MAKARSRRRSASMTIPLAVVAGFGPIISHTWNGYQQGGLSGALNDLSAYTTGYVPADNQWKASHMIEGLGPVLAGILVHKFIGNKMGVNRMLASAGVPLVRL